MKSEHTKKYLQEIESELVGLTSDDIHTKKLIDEAWNELKENKKNMNYQDNFYLKNLGEGILENNISKMKSYYGLANENILEVEQKSSKIPKLVQKIQQNISLEKIEKPKPQTCFLFWCW